MPQIGKVQERAFTYDPTTFSYEVMTKSNIGWRPYWISRFCELFVYVKFAGCEFFVMDIDG